MKRYYYVIAGLIALSLFYFLSPSKKSSQASSVKNASEVNVVEDKVLTRSASPPRNPMAITKTEIKRMRETLPDVAKVKEEVGENPHQTPPSLLNFARSLGPPMEKALKNGDEATLFMSALEDCALSEAAAHAARVLCVTNSQRLAETHRHLKEKAGLIRANVDPRVRKILERQDALNKD